MDKKILYGFNTEEEAIRSLREEVNNWTWLSRAEKDEIVKDAKVTEGQNRFGPIFSIEFKAA